MIYLERKTQKLVDIVAYLLYNRLMRTDVYGQYVYSEQDLLDIWSIQYRI
jgi:hypothetical protein